LSQLDSNSKTAAFGTNISDVLELDWSQKRVTDSSYITSTPAGFVTPATHCLKDVSPDQMSPVDDSGYSTELKFRTRPAVNGSKSQDSYPSLDFDSTLEDSVDVYPTADNVDKPAAAGQAASSVQTDNFTSFCQSSSLHNETHIDFIAKLRCEWQLPLVLNAVLSYVSDADLCR